MRSGGFACCAGYIHTGHRRSIQPQSTHLAALAGGAPRLDGDGGIVEAIVLQPVLDRHGAIAAHGDGAGHLQWLKIGGGRQASGREVSRASTGAG